MLKALTALAGALVLASAAGAQEENAQARLDLARETMALTGADGMVNQMLDMMMPTMRPALMQQYPDATDAQIAEAIDLIRDAFREASPELVDGGAQVYADLFTVEELEAINAFYRTPAGAKLVELLPEVTERSNLIGQRVATRVMMGVNPQINAIMQAGADPDAAP